MPVSQGPAERASAARRPLAAATRLLVVGVVAVVVLGLGAANASAFGVSGFTYSNSSLQAAGHPNVTVAFNRSGSESEDVKDVRLDLPTGVGLNPESVTTKCTMAQFSVDTCPSASQVGTNSTKVKAAGLLDITVPGTTYAVTPGASQVATFGMVLRPAKICILFVWCAQPSKVFLLAGAQLNAADGAGPRTFTQGKLSLNIVGIPLVFSSAAAGPLDITVNQMSLAFQARSGSTNAGPYFLTNTTSCSLATAGVTITSYHAATAATTKSFTPSGCASVPMTPTISTSVASPASAAPTALTVGLNVPTAGATIQNAHAASVDTDLPNGSSLAFGALAGLTPCSETQFVANTCPASSTLGTASATVPSITSGVGGFTGSIYATGEVGNQIPIGVRLVGARGTTVLIRGTLGVRGDQSVGTGHAYLRLDKLPQLAYSNLSLTLATGYRNPAACGPSTSSASIAGFNAAVVTRTSSYTVTSCEVTPDTTITPAQGSPTAINTPSFALASNVAGSQFQCWVDTAAPRACTSPFTTEPLGNGPHTLSVRAQNGVTLDPTPATSAFTVNSSGLTITPSIVPSTTAATAHPDLSTTFDISGAQPKTLRLTLPLGLAASLGAPNACTVANAAAGTCAAASKIGSGEVTVNTTAGPLTGSGDLYLTQPPTGSDAAGFAVKFAVAGGSFIAQGGVRVLANAGQQAWELRNIPTVIGSTGITVTQLKLNLSGLGGFLTNPSSCSSSTFSTTGTDASANQAAVTSVPFAATGCNATTFSPAVTESLTSPVAGTITGSTTDVAVAPSSPTIKTLRVTMPAALSVNYAALGSAQDRCPSGAVLSVGADFNPALCPAQAKIGMIAITSPIAASPLTGDVYLIDKAPLPMLGVKIDQGAISIRATALMSLPQVDPSCVVAESPLGYCDAAVSFVTDGLPDLPTTDLLLTLDGPDRTGVSVTLSGKPFQVAATGAPSCTTPSLAKITTTPFTGTWAITSTPGVAISGC